jgi:hypothetical protein
MRSGKHNALHLNQTKEKKNTSIRSNQNQKNPSQRNKGFDLRHGKESCQPCIHHKHMFNVENGTSGATHMLTVPKTEKKRDSKGHTRKQS